MPLTGNFENDVKELYHDNKLKGKEKGANGKERSKAQIMAIAYAVAKRKK